MTHEWASHLRFRVVSDNALVPRTSILTYFVLVNIDQSASFASICSCASMGGSHSPVTDQCQYKVLYLRTFISYLRQSSLHILSLVASFQTLCPLSLRHHSYLRDCYSSALLSTAWPIVVEYPSAARLHPAFDDISKTSRIPLFHLALHSSSTIDAR